MKLFQFAELLRFFSLKLLKKELVRDNQGNQQFMTLWQISNEEQTCSPKKQMAAEKGNNYVVLIWVILLISFIKKNKTDVVSNTAGCLWCNTPVLIFLKLPLKRPLIKRERFTSCCSLSRKLLNCFFSFFFLLCVAGVKDSRLYSCPIYKKPVRTDINYIAAVDLKTSLHPEHWILRGVALLCDVKWFLYVNTQHISFIKPVTCRKKTLCLNRLNHK